MNTPYPKYQPIQQVTAFQISHRELLGNLNRLLHPVDTSLPPLEISDSFYRKHCPQKGDYYVCDVGSDVGYILREKEFNRKYKLIEEEIEEQTPIENNLIENPLPTQTMPQIPE